MGGKGRDLQQQRWREIVTMLISLRGERVTEDEEMKKELEHETVIGGLG